MSEVITKDLLETIVKEYVELIPEIGDLHSPLGIKMAIVGVVNTIIDLSVQDPVDSESIRNILYVLVRGAYLTGELGKYVLITDFSEDSVGQYVNLDSEISAMLDLLRLAQNLNAEQVIMDSPVFDPENSDIEYLLNSILANVWVMSTGALEPMTIDELLTYGLNSLDMFGTPLVP